LRIPPYDRDGTVATLKTTRARIALLAALLCILVAVLWIYRKEWFPDTPPPPQKIEKDYLTVFIPSPAGRLEKKIVETSKSLSDRQKAQEVLQELRRQGAVPDKLVFLDMVAAADGTVYLNLSKEILEEKVPPIREATIIYAIVNSLLANLRDARKIHLLVDGKAVYTLHGTMYIYEALEFNKDLMEE
jgi:hypothetical protein